MPLDWICATRARAVTFVLVIGSLLAIGSGLLGVVTRDDEPAPGASVTSEPDAEDLIDRERARILVEQERQRAEEAFPEDLSPEWSVAETPWGRIPCISVSRGGRTEGGVALSCAWPEDLAPLPADPPR